MADLIRLSDEDLAHLAREGHEDAWEVLYVRSVEFLRGYALQLGCDPDSAEDLVQETLLRAWESRGSYERSYPYRSWLRTILWRLTVTQQRRARTFQRLCDLTEVRRGEGVWRGAAPIDAATLVERTEEERRIGAALNKLTHLERAVLVAWAEGEDPSDMARRCGLVASTVRGRLHRARRKFVAAYEELFSRVP